MGKLVDRSKPSVFIGYAEGEKAYRILDPLTQRVKVACDVVFDEGHGWDWSKPDPSGSASAASDFTVESWWPRGAGGAQIFGGGWTFITSVAYTTTSVALTVTKSEGAQSHIGSCTPQAPQPATTTCIPSSCLTSSISTWRSTSSRVYHTTGGRGPFGCLL